MGLQASEYDPFATTTQVRREYSHLILPISFPLAVIDESLMVVCLVGFDVSTMTHALTYKRVIVGNEDIASPLTVEQCRASRDAVAKTIYSSIFDWLVQKVNEAFAVCGCVGGCGCGCVRKVITSSVGIQ